MKYGMVINLIKCIGCYGCTTRCIEEHMLPPDMLWNRVLISETGVSPDAIKHIYPVLCNHCEEPACVDACPFGARMIGNLKDPNDPVTKIVLTKRVAVLKDYFGTKPQVYYLGMDENVR